MEADNSKVQKAYYEGNDRVREVLRDLFGDQLFPITTYEDAANTLSVSYTVVKAVRALSEQPQKQRVKWLCAALRLEVIARALNGTVNETGEYWQPKFEKPSDSELTYAGTNMCNDDNGTLPSYRTKELAEYAAKVFFNEYRKALCSV